MLYSEKVMDHFTNPRNVGELDLEGGNMACIMNAANEAAVAAFLKEQIGFYDITDIIQECMSGAEFVRTPDLETIFNTNETVLARASEIIRKISGRKSF